MVSRNVKVTQAEIERAIRAAEASGLNIVRIVARADGYVLETTLSMRPGLEPAASKPKPVL